MTDPIKQIDKVPSYSLRQWMRVFSAHSSSLMWAGYCATPEAACAAADAEAGCDGSVYEPATQESAESAESGYWVIGYSGMPKGTTDVTNARRHEHGYFSRTAGGPGAD